MVFEESPFVGFVGGVDETRRRLVKTSLAAQSGWKEARTMSSSRSRGHISSHRELDRKGVKL
jgi:hypothetical protein